MYARETSPPSNRRSGDCERRHPDETLDDANRRASFSKEDRGLLRDWMAIAAIRAAANRKDAIDARRLTVTADIGSGGGPPPKSFGLSIKSTRVYLSRTALKASSPSCKMRRKRQGRVMMH
jgi:hypothetical protein